MRIYLLSLIVFILISGCATAPIHKPGSFQAPVHRGLGQETYKERPLDVDDPWEGFNRHMYHFNAKFDRYVYLPIVNVYEEVLPVTIQNGISNVFNNLKEVPIFFNSVLQGDPKKASVALGRFVFNTTIGLGGLVDVLGNGGIYQGNEDFGQTLGVWGVPAGPYLVLPIFGPSGVRDAGGMAVDGVVSFATTGFILDEFGWAATTAVTPVRLVDARHQVKFRYYETGTPFEYQLVRFVYVKKRELDISK